MWWSDFHFLRPWVLLALVPLAAITVALFINRRHDSRWGQLIDPGLLEPLLDNRSRRRSPLLLWALAAAWLASVLALAGPTWEQRPTPVHRQADALVLLLDLSPSMVAEDVKPRRIVRARLKIADILEARTEGETGLVVYGGDAHAVTPLTDDTDTIESLLPTLSPSVMPVPGSRVEAGIERATQLLKDAGYADGRILLVTDGVTQTAARTVRKRLKKTDYELSILGIGTPEGAPIPSGSGGFIRSNDGSVVIAKLDPEALGKLASATGGRYRTAGFNRSDIQTLLGDGGPRSPGERQSDNKMDEWVDRGPWLALALLPVVLLAFRRGVLLAVLILPLGLVQSPGAQAASLDALYLNADQRGRKLMQQQEHDQAANTFKDPQWRASALYRAGDYEAAAEAFGQLDNAQAHYNRGNALAKAGNLEGAMEAYDQALEQNPELDDARNNKKLVEQLKKQREQQQKQNNQQQNSSQKPSDDSQQQSQKNQNSQNPNSQNQQGASEERESQQQSQQQGARSSQGRQNGQNQAGASSRSGGQRQQQGQSSARSGQNDREQAAGGNRSSQTGQSSSARAQATAASEGSQGNQSSADRQAQPLTREEREAQQAMEQWLRQIPDDPAGLMRNKFRYEYQQKRTERMRDQLNQFDDDEQRW